MRMARSADVWKSNAVCSVIWPGALFAGECAVKFAGSISFSALHAAVTECSVKLTIAINTFCHLRIELGGRLA
ncbi:hypothetical protein D777_01944 [Marinobacter nitratireducens]|uniref:Uncharacterized protein n=1 Tax=Marinobacter nitratireducens TaxID=1137280 RepID=A0A072NEV6_9GAMM|nr:hypothetical protein D777_01944 [Marinobacter nitratireducens]